MTEIPGQSTDPHARIYGNISYWLIPSEEFYRPMQEIIGRIAEQFGATVFEPHVTIFSGPYAKGARCDEILKDVVEGLDPVTLRVGDVRFSEQFTKTLFVELASSHSLEELSRRLRSRAGLPSDFRLMPHISLAYLNSSPEVLSEIASSVDLGLEIVRFDGIKAVATQASVTSDEDVREWFVVAAETLT